MADRILMPDAFSLFLIDRHAFRYFGIIRFLDRPGYFPQLKAHDTAARDLISEYAAKQREGANPC